MKHTEQEVRDALRDYRRAHQYVGMLEAYADLLAQREEFEQEGKLVGPERMTQPAAVPDGWREAVSKLVFAARTSGGTAGRDEALCKACDTVESMLAAAPQPSQAEPQQADFRTEFPLAFVTTQSGGGDYKLVLSFGTIADMHRAHDFILGRKRNAGLDTDRDTAKHEERWDVAGSVAVGQQVDRGQDKSGSHPLAQTEQHVAQHPAPAPGPLTDELIPVPRHLLEVAAAQDAGLNAWIPSNVARTALPKVKGNAVALTPGDSPVPLTDQFLFEQIEGVGVGPTHKGDVVTGEWRYNFSEAEYLATARNIIRAALSQVKPQQAEPQQAEPVCEKCKGDGAVNIGEPGTFGHLVRCECSPAPVPLMDAQLLDLMLEAGGVTKTNRHGTVYVFDREDLLVGSRAIEHAALSQVKATAVSLTPGDAEVKFGSPECPWTSLLAYVLQGDMHNRLTPRVIDIAYTAFTLAKQPNSEDGGPSDWFTDTKPTIEKAIAKLRTELFAERAALAQQGMDADQNAPWLALAHIICADAGIPPGHITARLEALRDKIEQQGKDAERWQEMAGASNDFWLAVYNTRPDLRAGVIDAAIAAKGGAK